MDDHARGKRRAARARRVAMGVAMASVLTACQADSAPPTPTTQRSSDSRGGATPGSPTTKAGSGRYPLHTAIVSTTFWVGEIFDPNAPDGSQVYSTYDSAWERHYGGCDGVIIDARCQTEKRTAATGFFPVHMKPAENPFYLDLPFDDVNDPTAFGARCRVIPWADDAGYAGHCANPSFSYMKNRWVKITGPNADTCYGQIEDAGPGQYHDAAYVFGDSDERPANGRYGGAGADVSPALNGCLGFAELDGDSDRISWRFVDVADVPAGPWTQLVTTSGVTE